MESSTDRDAAFPPWWVTLLTACIISVPTFLALFLTGVGENTTESDQSRQNRGILLMVLAVIPAWLSYIWTNQGHHLHGTASYVLGFALCAIGLTIAV